MNCIDNVLDACCLGLACAIGSVAWLWIADKMQWWPF